MYRHCDHLAFLSHVTDKRIMYKDCDLFVFATSQTDTCIDGATSSYVSHGVTDTVYRRHDFFLFPTHDTHTLTNICTDAVMSLYFTHTT